MIRKLNYLWGNKLYPKIIVLIFFTILLSNNSIFAIQQENIDKDNISFKTKDDFKISAFIGKPEEIENKLPAVILIHQGGSSKKEWNGFFEKLVNQNYVVLAYDIRGHGESDKVENIYALFNDPKQAPLDLRAAIEYLKSDDEVDTNRIAIVGASIGANLACVGSELFGIKTAVAISGKTSAVINLSGVKKLSMKSVFYIASEGDQNGKRVQWAKELFDNTEPPRKFENVKGSSAHGVSIFKDKPSVKDEIILWLKKTL